MDVILSKIINGVLTIVLFSWIWNRSQKKADELERRIAIMEQGHMTKEEFIRRFESISQDRHTMHKENLEQIQELKKTIDFNEVKRSKTEHDILNIVNGLSLKAAALEAVELYKQSQVKGN